MELDKAKATLELIYEKNIDPTSIAEQYIEAKLVFIQHYKENPKAFIEDFIRIIHGKTNEECPFILNDAQQMLLDSVEDNRFVACPKARQLGITTLTNALALHHSIFAKNANVICMAFKTENAQENLRRIKTMFSSIPKWVQHTLITFNKEKHQNNVGLWSFFSKVTNTDNKLEVATASSVDATRGKTPTFLHWTETAFADEAEGIFTSIFPALNRRKDSIIILESTGNGNQGFYYEVCMGIRKGFSVIFMPWHVDKDYRVPCKHIDSEDMYYITDLMGVVSIPDFLDKEQIAWFRETSETIGKAKCQQEYPLNIEQVFMATNYSWFATKTMHMLPGEDPLYTLAFEHGYLVKRPGAPGLVYEELRQDYEYLLGIDSSEGKYDPSVFTILNPKGEEVLFWREKLTPDNVVLIANALGKHFNNAKIFCESNAVGAYVIAALQQQFLYPNMLSEDGKVGFRTHVSNKPVILSNLQEYILKKKVKFRNHYLATEMSHFEADTMRAKKNEHDDTVMSCAIATWGFKTQPPLYRYVQENYADYTREVYGREKGRRKFII